MEIETFLTFYCIAVFGIISAMFGYILGDENAREKLAKIRKRVTRRKKK